MTSKLAPIALLNDIEATWREASAFSNTANNLIERGLPELRALLATPMPPQSTAQPDPIIGVLKSNLADGVMPSFSGGDLKHLIKLLEAPQSELAALREELGRYQPGHEALYDKWAAAEQQNAKLINLLKHFASCADVRNVGTGAMDEVAAMSKPTESGAGNAKICVECEQPYCHGVCVERGDDQEGTESGASE